MAKRALVIGSETFSRILDWQDRSTCVLFGDGAGAVVLETTEQAEQGILATKLYSNGRHKDKLYVNGGVSTTQTTGTLQMTGKDVFKFAIAQGEEAVFYCLKQAGLTGKDIDWFVPHQANKRIIDSLAKKLDISEEKIIITVDIHGNTSAASIPLALAHGVSTGKIKKGDIVLLEAVGGGFTWGAMIIKW